MVPKIKIKLFSAAQGSMVAQRGTQVPWGDKPFLLSFIFIYGFFIFLLCFILDLS